MIDITTAWKQHHGIISGFLRRRLANPADAEDLLQETFLRLHRASPPGLADDSAVRAWLLRTARNLLTDHYRAARPTVRLEDDPADEGRRLPTPLESLEPCITPLVSRLPEKYRQALALDLEGVPQREIASRTGVGLSGAKSRVQRARDLLRGEFERCCAFTHDEDDSLLDYRVRREHPTCA